MSNKKENPFQKLKLLVQMGETELIWNALQHCISDFSCIHIDEDRGYVLLTQHKDIGDDWARALDIGVDRIRGNCRDLEEDNMTRLYGKGRVSEEEYIEAMEEIARRNSKDTSNCLKVSIWTTETE